ncbi:Asp-tRNA(Asn)/Glu-tRNA(Gln) amidotransferase subunit GatC [Fodinicurvata halophila]|uniref:Aspartyl/glutamyl-tRNA(Asn/Gln) amidotransferase subunit C n=1 Tax=Fodinicurvata halophila TaxID=1419723 RepID=A0ABV8UQM5_9PROT
MSVDKDTVAHIAKLARLRMDPEKTEAMAGELSQIFGWIEQLGEVDTTGVAPMTSVAQMKLPLREDEVSDGGYPEDVLRNAPESLQGFYVVPKVVE